MTFIIVSVGKKKNPEALNNILWIPGRKVKCPWGGAVTTGPEEWEFLWIFANALLQFSSRWREPWAKLGLSEQCLWGILRGLDNPFRLSSHRRVCSAAAPWEITGLLSTYKIPLWNEMVRRQTSQIFLWVCVCACVTERNVVSRVGEGQTKSKYEYI